MPEMHPEFLDVDGIAIALRRQQGAQPGIVWLGGYKSDMLGTKAETLAAWSATNGRAFLRHGHWIDRALGVVFLMFAASLAMAAAR